MKSIFNQSNVQQQGYNPASVPRSVSISFALLCAVMLIYMAAPVGAIPLSILTDQKTNTGEQPNSAPGSATALQSAPPAAGDTAYALCPLHELQFAAFGGSDCWGYTSGGSDYAIMGINDGLVFVDALSGAVLDTIPGPKNSCGSIYWRDMATMGNYCYAVSECSGTNEGIIVIDLSFLPDSAHYVGSFNTGPGRVTSHNLSIDSIAGYLYVEGIGASGSNIFVHSLADPAAPAYVAGLGDLGNSIHDMYAIGDILYIAEGSVSSFSIWEVSDKLNPNMLARWTTPSAGYAHNIWPTPDETYVITTEETVGRTVKIWDVSDYGNVQLAAQYLAPSDLAHNAQVKGDKLYISHYESGVRVLDITDPTNPLEIAAFDTYPNETGNYNGAWGVYNFSPNGFVYASNVGGRLYILQEDEIVITDSMFVDSVEAAPGDLVRVDISVTNSLAVKQFIVPFTWASSGDVEYSHASIAGLRTEYFKELTLTSYNPFGDQAALRLLSSADGSVPPLDPGSGPVLSLYFTVAGGVGAQFNPVVVEQVGGSSVAITTDCSVVIEPSLVAGGITITPGCCEVAGDADHNGSVSIADATYLISRIFSGGPAPTCNDEADADGSNSISIGDVTYVIARIFSGGPAPICGQTGM